MMKTSVAKKAVMFLMAGCFAFGGTFAVYNPPRAEAGLFDIGDVIQAGVQIAQARDTVRKQLDVLDKTADGQQYIFERTQSQTGVYIMGPLSRPHSKILRVSEENLFYAAKRLKYSLSGTSYPSAS
jgi:hypothetical protein